MANTANIFSRRRRQLLISGSALGIAMSTPLRLLAGVAELPHSEFGFATTADEVVAGLDLTGRTVLITGVNSGIGYDSMKSLAARGAHVLGAARTLEKAETACASVSGKTTPLVCELSDFASVAACAAAVRAMDKPVDMLICNAGIMALPKLEQVYGLEKQFVVNHLGHYILTRNLLPAVEAAPAGRIVTVSSLGYKSAPAEGIQFDNLSGDAGYKPFTAYGQSKLANALFAFELARRYSGTSVTANTVHPGLVATNLGRYFMKKPRDPDAPLREGFKTSEQGASTQVYVAAHPTAASISGYYFEDCNPAETTGPHMGDAELSVRLWDVSEQLTADYLV